MLAKAAGDTLLVLNTPSHLAGTEKVVFHRHALDSFLFLWERISLTPADRLAAGSVVSSSPIPTKMPVANGDVASNGTRINRNVEKLDYRKALEILESEYETKDGLDIQTLLNSTKNGALTYNDFLVLPGYIGMMLRSPFWCAPDGSRRFRRC